MENCTLKRKSWHYRLADLASPTNLNWYTQINFCTYARYVVTGVLLSIVLAVVAVLAGVGIVTLVSACVLWMYNMVVAGALLAPIGDAFIGLVILVLVGIVFGTHAINKHRAKRAARPKSDAQPGFFGLLVTKIKTKTCFKINLED
jgi:hypothetical protein